MRISLFVAAAFFTIATPLHAAEPVDNDYFEKKVRPILATNCVTCHGAKKQKGGFRLDARAAFVKGGDNGPAIVAGDTAKSLLVQAINYRGDIQMPPKGKLSDKEIAILTAWVKGGAPWPDDGPITKGTTAAFDLHARAKTHWSFQLIHRPALPKFTGRDGQATNEIDRFLLAELSRAGLNFAPPAEKRVLLRRIYFDLIGMPPRPEEMDAFLKDESPQAYEKVVERLLASPHYGERWGRHWLDLVRFAETQGHEFDYEIPGAWRYRDYVVRAINADIPFDQFLTEQIAGDLLSNPRRDPRSGVNESLLATGFWWLGEAKHSPVDSRAEYADHIDNQIDVFGKAIFGLTLACARCHDHKFDPVSAKDYYSLFSVLASSRYSRDDVNDPAPTLKILEELATVRTQLASTRREPAAQKKADAPRSPQSVAWREKSVVFETFGDGWRSRWDAIGLALRPETGAGIPHSGREAARLTGALRSPTFLIDKPFLAVRVAGRGAKARLILNGLQLIQNPIYGGLAQGVNHGEELRWITFDLRMWKGQPAYLELLDDSSGWFAISEARFADAPPPGEAGVKISIPETPSTNNVEVRKITARIRELEAKLPTPAFAPTTRDGNGRDEHVFIRGNHKTLGVRAPRATLEVFSKPPFHSTGSGRLELAKSVTDTANPLVARVIVNRLWKHHFGEGIVRSPDDFGKQGQLPTHPELLDWLASELVSPTRKSSGAKPWSLKSMHRLMVLSTAYRQSSQATPEQAAKALTADPQNKLLYRQNVQRLEAEAIRDALLVVSGRLDAKVGGPGALPYLTEYQVGRGRPASGPLDGNRRRSIYLQVRRNFLNPMFSAFDYPTPATCIGRRTASNVPAQALVMLNNPFVIQQAELWAKHILSGESRSAEARVREMYTAAFGREPTSDELRIATDFVKEQSQEYGKPDHLKAWSDLAHVLFNAKEFIFVE